MSKPSANMMLLWGAAVLISALYLSPVVESLKFFAGMPTPEGGLSLKERVSINPAQVSVLFILLLFPLMATVSTPLIVWLAAIGVYAFCLALIWQWLFRPDLMYNGWRAAWPMADPSNAAALVSTILVPLLCLSFKSWACRLWAIVPLLALLATHSKAGIIGCILAVVLYAVYEYRRLRLPALGAFASGLVGMRLAYPEIVQSFMERFPVWVDSVPLLKLWGTGVGTFFIAYQGRPIVEGQRVYFAHNDIYQFAIEMGVVSLVFVGLCLYVIRYTRKENIIPACAMGGILAQSMVGFPLYVPTVSAAMGILYFAWARLGEEDDDGR